MSFEVVNSYNLYVDSERDRNAQSTGDKVSVNLNETPITCASNQFLRLSLQSFSMYNSSTNVNLNNNIFRVSCSKAGGANNMINKPHFIPPFNPTGHFDLFRKFGNTLDAIINEVTGKTASSIDVIDRFGNIITRNEDNFMRIRLNYSAGHDLSVLVIKFFVEDGDIFELLGGNRLYEIGPTTNETLESSLFVDFTTSANEVILQSFYPTQLSTQQNTYLKTNLNSTALQTKSYSAGFSDQQSAGAGTESSKILGKIINNTQFNTFTTQTNEEFFIDLTTRNLNFIELSIEDSHGRPVPPAIFYKNSLTTSLGSDGFWTFKLEPDTTVETNGNQQNTLGNRSFEACLKVDVCQYTQARNNTLQAPPPPNPLLPRYTSNLLSQTEQETDYLNRF